MKKGIRIMAALLCAVMMLTFIVSCDSNVVTTAPGTTPITTPGSTTTGGVIPTSTGTIADGTFYPTPTPWQTESSLYVPRTYTDLGITDNKALTRYAAAESMVLLENKDQTLPLKKGAKIAIFGGGQIDLIKGGWGSGDVNVEHTVNLLEGLKAKEEEGKVEINKFIAEKYLENSKYSVKVDDARKAKETSDIAVLIFSRNSGEGSDRSGDFTLQVNEKQMLDNVTKAGFEKVVVILNIPGVMDTSWIDTYPAVKSALIAWQPGMEGGNAIADILCGDVNPSGKLADTIAKKYRDYPSSATYLDWDNVSKYTEDIFVGYRYFETFDPNYEKVSYEFGYGSSYTTFDIQNVKVECDGVCVKITATVKNTGSYAGKEVLQVYYSAPQGKLGNPGKELATFIKTKLIEPGDSEEIAVSFDVRDMASYDDTGKIRKSAYILEKGDYKIYVGNSIKNAGENGVRYTYTLAKDTIVEQLSEKLKPIDLSNRLLADGTYEKLETEWNGVLINDSAIISVFDYNSYHLGKYNDADYGVFDLESEVGGTPTVVGMKIAENDKIKFDIQIPKAGKYTVTLVSGAAGSGKIAEAFTVSIGNKKSSVSINKTGTRFTYGLSSGAEFELLKGRHTITLTCNDFPDKALLGYVIVTAEGSSAKDVAIPTIEDQPMSFGSKKVESFLEVYADRSKMEDFVNGLTVEELVSLACAKVESIYLGTGTVGDIPELYIPGVDNADGPAGLRLGTSQTAWPIQTALACSFNTDLVYSIGAATGREAEEVEIDYWLTPGVNIHRNPYCGRNFEYYSEDPYLSGIMAAALTLGCKSEGLGVTVKHYALNNIESNRKSEDSQVSERAAREIYLKPFEICVKLAQPGMIMTSFNKVNGVYSSERRDLVEEILRGEWGYQGIVTTDWENYSPQYKVINSGNDIVNPDYYCRPEIVINAYKAGIVTLETLRATATRVLNIVVESESMKELAEYKPFEVTNTAATHIKASEYYLRSPGILIEKTSDDDGGYNVGYLEPGRYLTYKINVKNADAYKFIFRLASQSGGGSFDILLDGEKLASYSNKISTGAWQTWKSVIGPEVTLPEGEHELTFKIKSAGINFNWIEIIDAETSTDHINAIKVPASADAFRVYGTDFSDKTDRISTEACEDESGGRNLMYTEPGEWASFKLDFADGGKFGFDFRLASPDGKGAFDIYVDGVKVSSVKIPEATGGWQTWKTYEGPELTIEKGVHEIKIQFTAEQININWFEMTKK